MQQPIVGPGLCACGCGKPALKAFAHGHSRHNGPIEFWRRIPSHLGPDVCWPWPGPFDHAGYGAWSSDKVHRLMYEHANGPVPEGHGVLHHCDNPPCCNPACLFTGTQQANTADMVSKGRESRPAAKIAPADAAAIRQRYASEAITQRALAREYGLAQSQVSRIVNRKRWKVVA